MIAASVMIAAHLLRDGLDAAVDGISHDGTLEHLLTPHQPAHLHVAIDHVPERKTKS